MKSKILSKEIKKKVELCT